MSKSTVLKEYEGKTTGPDQAPKLFDERRTGIRKTTNLRIKMKTKNGSAENGEFLGSVIAYGEVNSTGFGKKEKPDSELGTVGIIRDVTEKYRQEQLLKDSLEEKTILLREVHHRVKNNLQIISSLLNLHIHESPYQERTSILRELESEIHSMAIVHDQLCNSGALTRIDMQAYIESLFDHLSDLYDCGHCDVEHDVNAAEISLRLESATPLGLIINELVSNAMKYAFGEQRKGSIRVDLTRESDGFCRLLVKDDGQGMSGDNGRDEWKNTGLQLVELLVDQLNGHLEYGNNGGFAVDIRIPDDIMV